MLTRDDGRRAFEAADRVALEIEFDEDDRLVADNPAVVPGLDRDDLRGFACDAA